MRDIPEHDRPRERLLRHGPTALTDAELVAVHLGSGRPGEGVLDLARGLLEESGGVAGLASRDVTDLARRSGVGPAKAARLVAAFALADRVAGLPTGRLLNSSEDIAAVAGPIIGRGRSEELLILVADGRNRVRRTEVIARGGADRCDVPLREVLSCVLRHDGVAFGVAHNHPAGSLEPSGEDIAVTGRLSTAAREVGLRFLDHVVVAGSAWRSVSASR
jgi:DNA repair protein RadC